MLCRLAFKIWTVEEEHPLKQGLKQPDGTKMYAMGYDVEEEHPLKQGLKLGLPQATQIPFSVEEEHPLKQGLKPIM